MLLTAILLLLLLVFSVAQNLPWYHPIRPPQRQRSKIARILTNGVKVIFVRAIPRASNSITDVAASTNNNDGDDSDDDDDGDGNAHTDADSDNVDLDDLVAPKAPTVNLLESGPGWYHHDCVDFSAPPPLSLSIVGVDPGRNSAFTFFEEKMSHQEHIDAYNSLKEIYGDEYVLGPFGLSSTSYHYHIGTYRLVSFVFVVVCCLLFDLFVYQPQIQPSSQQAQGCSCGPSPRFGANVPQSHYVLRSQDSPPRPINCPKPAIPPLLFKEAGEAKNDRGQPQTAIFSEAKSLSPAPIPQQPHCCLRQCDCKFVCSSILCVLFLCFAFSNFSFFTTLDFSQQIQRQPLDACQTN